MNATSMLEVNHQSPEEELAAVRTLMAEYAALPHTVGRWLTIGNDLAALPAPFLRPSGVLLLARSGDAPVGCGGFVAIGPGVVELKRMYVKPSARGHGVGAALLTSLLGKASELGFERACLDTAPELLAAQALYQQFGFVPIPHYRDGLLPDALCFHRSTRSFP